MQPAVTLEVGDVRDKTDECDRNSPEDDQSSDESKDCNSANDSLPPRNLQCLPNDLIGIDADVAWRHMEGLVVRQRLESSLGIRLTSELDEDASNLGGLSGQIACLCGFSLRNQGLQSSTAPIDCVDLLAIQAKLAELVCRTLLLGHPASRERSRFSITCFNWWLVVTSSFLDGLQSLSISKLNQFHFTSLENLCSLVAFLNQLIDLGGVRSDPNIFDCRTENCSELGLVEVVLGNRCEEYSACRDAIGVDWRHQEGLAKVDVVDALASDQEKNESKEEPCTAGVSKISILAISALIDIAHAQHVQLLFASTASNINWEEDRPGNAGAYEHDNHRHLQKSKEEVGIEGLMLENIGVWDFAKGGDPVEPSAWQGLRTLSMGVVSKYLFPLVVDRIHLLLAKRTQIGSWSIPSSLRSAQDQEYQKVNTSNKRCWCQSRDQA